MQNVKYLPKFYNLYMELYDIMKGPRKTPTNTRKRGANGAPRLPPPAPPPTPPDEENVLEPDDLYEGDTDEKRQRYSAPIIRTMLERI